MLDGYHHIQLAMPLGREDDARAFYVGVLGLDEVPKPPALIDRGGAWFRSVSGLELHLGVEVDFRPARKAHPGISVTDLDALAARLEAAGYEIGPIATGEVPGQRRFHAHDVFGNRLEFLQAVPAGE